MIRILLVEDNEMNLDMLNRRLKRRGFDVITARDGAEGVECAKAREPDLILMDMSLPVMDGYEATRILKAGETTRRIPILGLSAHAMSGDADKAIQAGCDDYDTKPVDLRRLLSKIDQLLQGPSTEPFPVVPRRESLAKPSPPPTSPILGTPPQARSPRPPEPLAATVPLQRPDSIEPAANKGHALLVIGNPEDRRQLSEQLRELGYASTHANLGNGEAAIYRQVAEGSFDALLLDHRTEGINAERLVRTLRLEAGSRDLPILLISRVDGLESAFRLIELGADFFLPMPVSNHLLEIRLTSARARRP